MLVNDVIVFSGIWGDRSIGCDCDGNGRRKSIFHVCWLSVDGGKGKAVGLIRALILPDGEVERVLIVGERLITHAEAGADHCFFRYAISKAKARSKVFVVGLAAEVQWVSVNPGEN